MAVPFWLWMFAHIILASASTASSKIIGFVCRDSQNGSTVRWKTWRYTVKLRKRVKHFPQNSSKKYPKWLWNYVQPLYIFFHQPGCWSVPLFTSISSTCWNSAKWQMTGGPSDGEYPAAAVGGKTPCRHGVFSFFFLCTPNQKHCKHMKSSYLKGQDGMVRGFQESGTWFPVLCYFSNEPSPSISYIIFSFVNNSAGFKLHRLMVHLLFKKNPSASPQQKTGPVIWQTKFNFHDISWSVKLPDVKLWYILPGTCVFFWQFLPPWKIPPSEIPPRSDDGHLASPPDPPTCVVNLPDCPDGIFRHKNGALKV